MLQIFSMLLMLGFDSMLGMVETITTAITDHFTNLREKSKLKWVVISCCSIGLICGLPLCTSAGMPLLGLLDAATCEGWVLLFVGVLEVVLVNWIYGVDKIFEHINEMDIHIPVFMKFYWRVCWKYITPGEHFHTLHLCNTLLRQVDSLIYLLTNASPF